MGYILDGYLGGRGKEGKEGGESGVIALSLRLTKAVYRERKRKTFTTAMNKKS